MARPHCSRSLPSIGTWARFTALLLAILLATSPTGIQAQTTFVVNSTDDLDDGVCDATHCSLREALTAAGVEAGELTIAFDIPGSGPYTIRPTSALPFLSGSTTVDGTTEPDFAGTPVIELDGTDAGDMIHGLNVAGTGNIIRGLVINRFSGNGISIGAEAQENRVEGCYIGTDLTGSTALGNGNAGVLIGEAENNLVGGPTASTRNLISGNVEGVTIVGATATGNLVQGNYIGTNASGNAAIPNGTGILLLAPDNTIGGVGEGAGNVISGNLANGVDLFGENATENTLQGNLIGADATGTIALGNGENGVALFSSATDNLIGGTQEGARNILSGNAFGILVADLSVTGTQIQGNFIGTNATGDGPIPNTQTGIIVWGKNTLIGGPESGAGNVISGNLFAGIDLGPESAETLIRGNYIGTDGNGSTAMGNSLGIFVNFSHDNIIGGNEAGAGNVISGNLDTNLIINGPDATGNILQGNFIGTDATGMIALENGRALMILDAADNTVGGGEMGAGNVISGNHLGISVEGATATGNILQGNYIGVDASGSGPMGNRGAGIRFRTGAAGNTLGGTEAGAGNVIANSSWVGVSVQTDAGTGNRILGNSIFDNSAMGIELNRDGVSANDEGDVDTGPNNLQNYPEITSAVTNGGGIARATLSSAPSSTYTLDFFSDTECDDSGYGEGRTPLGTTSLTTDATGIGSVTAEFSGITGTLVTATATDAEGSTSEFSACAALSTLGMESSPAGRTVTQGQAATYTINVAAQGGTVEGTMSLTCSGNPTGTTCSFDQNQITLAAGQASATMTVTTEAPADSPPISPEGGPPGPWMYWLMGLIAGAPVLLLRSREKPPSQDLVGYPGGRTRLGWRMAVFSGLVLVSLSCGDHGSDPPTGGTPPGNYSMTVTATWESVELTTSVTMVVEE